MFPVLFGKKKRAGAVPPTSPVTSAVTDTGTTPTTTALTLPSWATGFRVIPGETPVSEDEFDLYVKIGAGATKKVKLTRWKDRFLAAAAGVTVMLATGDGRTVGLTPVVARTTATDPAGVTGTANADRAGPPIWTPAAAHVTLADYHQTIQLSATDATERAVFVSEYDGAAWTAPRWYKLPATGHVNVDCTYKQIALANYDGVAVGVVAPTGATVGGTKGQMALPFPAITGVTWNVTTVAELKAALAGAVYGDLILIAAGTYALDIAVTRATFAANNGVSNRAGMEGITIRGATGTRSDVVITGDGTGSHGDWSLIHDFGNNTGYGCFRDLTFDFTGIAAGMDLIAGKWLCQNVRWTGASSNADDSISLAGNSTRAIVADCLYCDADNSGQDNWNGDGNAATNAAGRIRLIACGGTVAGPNANDQVITTHNGMPIEVYGGTYSDANANVIAPDALAGSTVYTFFVKTGLGSRKAGVTNDVVSYGCDYAVGVDGSLKPNMVYSKVTPSGFISSSNVFRESAGTNTFVKVKGCWLVGGGAGRGVFLSVAGRVIEWNMIENFPMGIWIGNAGATGTAMTTLRNNSFLSNTTAMQFDVATVPGLLQNDAARTSGTSINCLASLVSGDFNTLDATRDADYGAGGSDTLADAAFSTTAGAGKYLPDAAGNCDANGDQSVYDWIGGTDYFGWPLILGSTLVPRGARGRPVLTGDLIPDVWV